MKKIIQKILPWLFLVVVFYFLFKQTPPESIILQIKSMNVPLFVLGSVFYFFMIMILDCNGLSRILSRFASPIDFKETFLMRGVTYLLLIINYNLGQGAIALYMKKTHKTPAFKTLGVILFITYLDLSLVVLSALIATSIAQPVVMNIELFPWVLSVSSVYFPVSILGILLLKQTEKPAIHKLRKRFKLVDKLCSNNLLYTFRAAQLRDYFKFGFLRSLVILFIIVSFQIVLLPFGLTTSLIENFSRSPILMIVGTLPLTPQGLGTGQFVSVELYKNYLSTYGGIALSPEKASEVLVAATLLAAFANLAWKVIAGAICLTQKSRHLFEETK